MCRKEVETAIHLFSECAYAMNVRRLLIRHYMMTTNFTQTFCQGDYHDVIKTHGNKKTKKVADNIQLRAMEREVFKNFQGKITK
jgi:hypothetical protein